MSENDKNDELKEDYFEKIDEYLDKPFFKAADRKTVFLLGRYYNYMAYLESSFLKTQSMLTKLPMYTKRIDKDQVIKILSKCNTVASRLISRNKTTKGSGGTLRERLNDLIAEDVWESSNQELELAFMMGFSARLKKEKKEKRNG